MKTTKKDVIRLLLKQMEYELSRFDQPGRAEKFHILTVGYNLLRQRVRS